MQELDESLSKLESGNNLSEPVAEAAEEAKTLEEKHIKQAKCLGLFKHEPQKTRFLEGQWGCQK